MLIAGGGFGAVEAMLALRALAPERVRVTLISASPVLAYKPAATTESFDETPPRTYDLQAIAADVGASFRLDRLEAVASHDHSVRLDVLCFPGLRRPRARGGRPPHQVDTGRADVPRPAGGAAHPPPRRANCAPGSSTASSLPCQHGCSWPLPLYELALLTATHLQEHGAAGEVVLVSPEITPLQVFGAQASRLVADLLAERGVRFIGESDPQSVEHDGALLLGSGGSLDADCVVAVPELRGPRITGVPTDAWGFITTDALGGVVGLADVYAAGDMTSFPIKQGGLAAQQADLIAQCIASEHGAVVKEPRVQHVLRARLLGGTRPIFLRTVLDEFGQATGATLQHESFEEVRPPQHRRRSSGAISPHTCTPASLCSHRA